MTEIRPQAPGSANLQTNRGDLNAADYNADMAAAALAKELVSKLGVPSVISKKFAVRYGLFKALNHSPANKTGYDSTLRMKVYEQVAADSVNIDGKYFERIFSYLMKPKYVISGMPNQGNTFDQEEPSFGRKIINMFTGRSDKPQEQNV